MYNTYSEMYSEIRRQIRKRVSLSAVFTLAASDNHRAAPHYEEQTLNLRHQPHGNIFRKANFFFSKAYTEKTMFTFPFKLNGL